MPVLFVLFCFCSSSFVLLVFVLFVVVVVVVVVVVAAAAAAAAVVVVVVLLLLLLLLLCCCCSYCCFLVWGVGVGVVRACVCVRERACTLHFYSFIHVSVSKSDELNSGLIPKSA